MTGWRLTSSMPAMMRCLSSCFDVTRIWRRTERANLEKKPSIRLSQEPCLGVKVKSKRPGGRVSSQARVSSQRRRAIGPDSEMLDEAFTAAPRASAAIRVIDRQIDQIALGLRRGQDRLVRADQWRREGKATTRATSRSVGAGSVH